MNKYERKLTVDWGKEIQGTVSQLPKQRQIGAEATHHRGYIQIEKPLEKYVTGSAHEGNHNSLGFSGFGMYKYVHGAVYEGYFQDGQFHGDGTITYPKGQQLDGVWINGRLSSYSFRFADGLEFRSNWSYCEEPDRTFQIEFLHGLQPPKKEILSNRRATQIIPKSCFDTGDGYYNPKTKLVHNYQNEIQRICHPNEEEVILHHFRQFGDFPVGHNKDLFEHWTSGRSEEIENITKRMRKDNQKERSSTWIDLRVDSSLESKLH